MIVLPSHYPHAEIATATLLEWAHLPEPPYGVMRAAVPWLESDAEISAYLDGVVQGRIRRWRDGPLFECSAR